MTKNGKTTKRENIQTLLQHPDLTASEREYLENELTLLERKNKASRTNPAEEAANNALRVAILDNMQDNRLYTVTEISNEIAECNALSTSKITSLLKPLIEDGLIKRETVKGKSLYSKVI